MSIGARIREKRLEAGYNMTALAKRVGVSTSAVSNWEGENTTPRGDAIHNLARVLKTSEDYLLNGDEPDIQGGGNEVDETSAAPASDRRDPTSILDDAKVALAHALGVSKDNITLEMSVVFQR